MNPERLAELHRQRAIVRDHLAWLENEIAASTGAPATRPDLAASPPPAPVPPVPVAAPEFPAGVAPDPVAAAAAARRGCLFYAALLLLLGALTLVAIYFVRYRDRPVIFASPGPAAAPEK